MGQHGPCYNTNTWPSFLNTRPNFSNTRPSFSNSRPSFQFSFKASNVRPSVSDKEQTKEKNIYTEWEISKLKADIWSLVTCAGLLLNAFYDVYYDTFYRPDYQNLLMHPLLKRLDRAFFSKHATESWKRSAKLLKYSTELLKHSAELLRIRLRVIYLFYFIIYSLFKVDKKHTIKYFLQ